MDRLSSLPDEVIGHILSFLPAESFVRTSILAKEWRFIWTRFPVLGFTVEPEMTNNIHNTIDDEFKSWIDTIFARKVRNTVIRLNYHLTLPRCLFTSNTLVNLCIIDSGDIPKRGTVYFPALKRLQLVNVVFDSEESLAHLISGAPVLKELIIDRMMLKYPPSITVETKLRMEYPHAMKFDEPTLSYLRIRGSELPHIPCRVLRSLVEAVIDLSECRFPSSDLVSVCHHVLLYNVKCLTLSSRRIEIPDDSYLWDESFPNLIKLNLRVDWHFLSRFLICTENLRVLTIRPAVDHSTQCWMEPKQVPACLISHLERVNLLDFEWSTEQEFEMIKYILRNAKVLKTMNIIYRTRHYEEFKWDEKVEALNRLASFEMHSTHLHSYVINIV